MEPLCVLEHGPLFGSRDNDVQVAGAIESAVEGSGGLHDRMVVLEGEDSGVVDRDHRGAPGCDSHEDKAE